MFRTSLNAKAFGLAMAAAAMVSLSVVTTAGPADASSESLEATQMIWYNASTYYYFSPSPGGCINVDRGAPFQSVENYTDAGQIVYAGYNCSTTRDDNKYQAPQALSPSIRLYYTAPCDPLPHCQFRSYRHT
jgi:hypothetical protein